MVTPRDQPHAWLEHIRAVIARSKPELLNGSEADRERVLEELVAPARTRPEALSFSAPSSASIRDPWRLPDDSREPLECCLAAVAELKTRGSLSFASGMVLRALIMPKLRPAFEVQGDSFEPSDTYTWLTDQRELLRPRLRAVGRIRSDSAPYDDIAGTGFVVGSNLLMTNRHVANYFARGLGTQDLRLVESENADCDLKQEWERTAEKKLRFKRLLMLHPFWDIAVIEISGELDDVEPVEFMTREPESRVNRNVGVVGYPVQQYLEPGLRDDRERVFRGIYGKKRFQPGQLTEHQNYTTAIPNRDERRIVRIVGHDASTLAGNSGSAVFDLDTGAVVGVHYSGQPLIANYAVPAWELVRDPRVLDLGVKIVGPSPLAPDPEVEAIWAAVRGS